MNHRVYVGIIILALVLFGCQGPVRQPDYSLALLGPAAATEKPRGELGFLNDPDNFQFAVVADIYGVNRPGIFEEAVKKINLMQPEFTMCVGDLIAGYTKDKRLIDDQWKEFAALIAPLKMKFFMVPGNHDLSNLTMKREWEQRFGRTYYHFIYRNVLFLCLNSEDPPATHISDEQIEYVRKVLVENHDVRWTFAFLHKPLWLEKDTGWERIETMLAGRPHTVLAGHHHVYTNYERHGQSYIKLATTGGGSQLSGPTKGQFDHITWITVTDRGPIIAHLVLEGILDENIVTEDSMRLVEHLESGQWLDIGSIEVETGSFTTGAVAIRLANSGDTPLKIRGTFQPHSQLNLSKRSIAVTIAPRATETVRVEINSISPIKLPDLDPLELKISGVYLTPDRPPIVSEGTYQVDFRYSWQGPELIRNGRFAHLMEGWQTASRTPKAGTISVEAEELKVKVSVRDPSWSIVIFQPIGTLKAGIDYRLSFRAKNVGRPGVIAALIKKGDAGSPNIPIRVDGQEKKYQLLYLKRSMTSHTMNFRIHGQEDIEKAIFMFVFTQANEMLIDDVSLRSVDMAKAP